MNDTISRQAAIDALMEKDKKLRNINWYDKPYAEGECAGIDEALSIVSNLPPAQPERKTGHWVNVRDNNIADCSRCNARGRAWMNFCPICGADMRE